MVTMTYNGKHRTVRRGPRVYDLKAGTFDVHPEDVAALTEIGLRPKADDDDGDTGADAPSTDDKD